MKSRSIAGGCAGADVGDGSSVGDGATLAAVVSAAAGTERSARSGLALAAEGMR
jgi:hypothetical protein